MSWILYQNNAPCLTPSFVREFLAQGRYCNAAITFPIVPICSWWCLQAVLPAPVNDNNGLQFDPELSKQPSSHSGHGRFSSNATFGKDGSVFFLQRQEDGSGIKFAPKCLPPTTSVLPQLFERVPEGFRRKKIIASMK
ncbi:hypothetical protein AB6A40_003458 [Gnathostoma spinigerum]|uniref:Uncharacterized protein n=1 Tax=Gnathostoma spinigerum TaxID=75299 RepID=A0ABD6EF54_9BILA